MGLIKEPLDVDFYVDPRPMTKEDEKAISDYIKADKLKRSKKIEKALRLIRCCQNWGERTKP
jgi:hypothetical protein